MKLKDAKMAQQVYATKAEAVDDSYFQLGANFLTLCKKITCQCVCKSHYMHVFASHITRMYTLHSNHSSSTL